MATARLDRRHRAQTNLQVRRPLSPLATLFLLSAALFRLGVSPAVTAAPTTPSPNSQSLDRALGWVQGFNNDEKDIPPVLHPSPEFHIGPDVAASTPAGTSHESVHKQTTEDEHDASNTNHSTTNSNTTEFNTNHITSTNRPTTTSKSIHTRTLPSTTTQPQATPAPTHPPFPTSLYDTPGHAIGSGLFVGVAGTVILWVVGFVLKVYVMCVGRGVVRGWRVWARRSVVGEEGRGGNGVELPLVGRARPLQRGGYVGDGGAGTPARAGVFGLGGVGVGAVVGF